MLEPVNRYFRRLRWQISLLYLLAAFFLVFLIGFGSYRLLQYYFQYTTDLALDYTMAQVFREYGMDLPESLSRAEQTWLTGFRGNGILDSSNENDDIEDREEEDDSSDEEDEEDEDRHEDEAYDGQLAAVFFLPFDGEGQALLPGPAGLPGYPNTQQILLAAGKNNSDRRTLRLPDGRRVRLLTYRSPVDDGPSYFLVGRSLSDQDRVLGLYLMGLLALSSGMVVLLGLGGWWLSGRSLRPAQKAWDQQQTFVAHASHELRAPLTLIRATADYGLRSPSAEQPRQALTEIVQECDYMNHLVDDLLLLSRLDAGRLALDRQAIALDSFLPEIVAQAQVIGLDKGISIRLESVQGTVFADRTRLRQILWILLDNALRYTPAGKSIRVGAKPAAEQVEIYIEDTGAGIPAEHLPHVFERFYQASQPGADPGRGNGLGLSIGRALVEAHHGKMTISSQVDRGTCVRLFLPVQP